MDIQEIMVAGTIKSDGTLELDQKPNLAPGRVTVVLRQEAEAAPPIEEGWWPYMQRVRAEREAAGYHFMNEMEMAAHMEWLHDDDDRMDRIYREMDMDRRCQEKG
jgi:hypothetical protein